MKRSEMVSFLSELLQSSFPDSPNVHQAYIKMTASSLLSSLESKGMSPPSIIKDVKLYNVEDLRDWQEDPFEGAKYKTIKEKHHEWEPE